MASEMVEAVARALIARLRADAIRFRGYAALSDTRSEEYPADEFMPPPNNGTYDGPIDAVALDRAAIEAMLEPTAEMRRAFYEHEDATESGFARAWSKALSASLQPDQPKE